MGVGRRYTGSRPDQILHLRLGLGQLGGSCEHRLVRRRRSRRVALGCKLHLLAGSSVRIAEAEPVQWAEAERVVREWKATRVSCLVVVRLVGEHLRCSEHSVLCCNSSAKRICRAVAET